MKKLLIISLGTLTFACGNTENSNLDSNTADESVEIGSGDEISPQLKSESDSSNALEVDTVSSAAEIN
ncbi:hypothetical protein [Rufibacter latericius]|uniref:Uncharacterized protein n=1 Tax=Rufibacter latericius TaxID=2487040 RepID=A0A3M9MEY2_9BACT|nr:hypothetical protein [Rufibacter latericius]RNI24121.1 hypothetical protein EFB08_17250 [Rufibacter latericius]